MGRIQKNWDQNEECRVLRQRNQACSANLLEALRANHGAQPEIEIIDPEPELADPSPDLAPIPNKVIEVAAEIAFPKWVNAIKRIQHAVCAEYNIKINEMCSPRRSVNIVRPRQIAMYLCKTLTDRSYPEIGRKFGGRDHSTVISAIRRVETICASDEEFSGRVQTLSKSLEASIA